MDNVTEIETKIDIDGIEGELKCSFPRLAFLRWLKSIFSFSELKSEPEQEMEDSPPGGDIEDSDDNDVEMSDGSGKNDDNEVKDDEE